MAVRVYSWESFVAGLITCALMLAYFLLFRRPGRNPVVRRRFVYVNQDGTVREVSPAESDYLSQDFAPNDSAGPYIKANFESRDGWGSLSGFMNRTHVPLGVTIHPVHPDYDARDKAMGFDPYADSRAAGEIVEKRPDGSIVTHPNPNVPPEERFERLRQCHLEIQRQREALARIGPPPLPTTPPPPNAGRG